MDKDTVNTKQAGRIRNNDNNTCITKRWETRSLFFKWNNSHLNLDT